MRKSSKQTDLTFRRHLKQAAGKACAADGKDGSRRSALRGFCAWAAPAVGPGCTPALSGGLLVPEPLTLSNVQNLFRSPRGKAASNHSKSREA